MSSIQCHKVRYLLRIFHRLTFSSSVLSQENLLLFLGTTATTPNLTRSGTTPAPVPSWQTSTPSCSTPASGPACGTTRTRQTFTASVSPHSECAVLNKIKALRLLPPPAVVSCPFASTLGVASFPGADASMNSVRLKNNWWNLKNLSSPTFYSFPLARRLPRLRQRRGPPRPPPAVQREDLPDLQGQRPTHLGPEQVRDRVHLHL